MKNTIIIGGIALILGLATQCVAVVLVLEFLVIIAWRIKNKHAFVGGWELDLLIFGALLVLLFNGGGAHTLDRVLCLGYFGW